MNEYTVVTVVIALFGFVVAVLALASKVTKPMNEMNINMAVLNKSLETTNDTLTTISTQNTSDHRRIWTAVEKNRDDISEVDKRVIVLEHDN